MNEVPERIRSDREKWRFRRKSRPNFALEPGWGQESVWDYPRPSRLERDSVGRGHARWEADRRVEVVAKAAWRYPKPFQGFEEIAGYIAFYPAKVECRVAGERVTPQPGGFYAGWVTAAIVGPFKGAPGTEWW